MTVADGKLGDEALMITVYVPGLAALTVSVRPAKGEAGLSVTVPGLIAPVSPLD